jgi:hypothetical protein
MTSDLPWSATNLVYRRTPNNGTPSLAFVVVEVGLKRLCHFFSAPPGDPRTNAPVWWIDRPTTP